MSQDVKIQRSNRNPKERFSGFLDKENMKWLREAAEEEERSIASMLNRILRERRHQAEESST